MLCYSLTCVIQAHKTGNIPHVQLFVHVQMATLQSQVWQVQLDNLSQCIGIMNKYDLVASFYAEHPPYLISSYRLCHGTTVLVCWLLFCSRPRTVVIFDDLILFPSHLSLSGVVCVINKLSTSYTINIYSILIILLSCAFFCCCCLQNFEIFDPIFDLHKYFNINVGKENNLDKSDLTGLSRSC